MSQPDVEAIRARYEAASRGDPGAVFRDVHPDFELKTADRAPNAGTYRGAQAATGFYADLAEPFEQVVYEPQECFARGDRVVVYLRARFRPKGSSAVVENRVAAFWTMRDGLPVRCEMFARREQALGAAGLSQQDRTAPT
jgi:ketosteroid isomerase-like protein